MANSPVYANSSNQIASLKELYTDDKDYMQDLVYKENPFFALVPKNESPDGFWQDVAYVCNFCHNRNYRPNDLCCQVNSVNWFRLNRLRVFLRFPGRLRTLMDRQQELKKNEQTAVPKLLGISE